MGKQTEYSARYNKKNTKSYTVRFNKKSDAEVIEWLSTIENKAGYFRDLIKADMFKKRYRG